MDEARDAFRAGEYRRFAAEEVHEMVKRRVFGRLVSDVSADVGHAVAPVVADDRQSILHRYVCGAEAGAQFLEDVGGGAVVQVVVNLAGMRPSPQMQRHGGYPFPIAVMPQEEGDAAPPAQVGVHLVEALEPHPPAHLFLRHGGEFQRLHEVVGQEAVEAAFGASDFLYGHFGEAVREVVARDASAVADYGVHESCQHVGQQVQGAQRQQRDEVNEGVNYL